jgi:hypothetical protein
MIPLAAGDASLHMVTVATSYTAVRPVNRQRERIYFGGLSLLMLATVLLGFGQSYFLAGMVRAPLPSRMIHVHSVVFTLWILLFVVQAMLVPAGRLKWHKQLGLWSYGLAAVMLPVGLLAATDSLRRGFRIGSFDPAVSYAISVLGLLAFEALILPSYLARRRPDVHKRLVTLGTLSLMPAAINRWPYDAMGLSFGWAKWIFLALLMLPVAYDLISLRRVHRATLWAVPFIYVAHALQVPVGSSGWWHTLSFFLAMH